MRLTKALAALAALATLAACEPPVPDSTARGTGFETAEEAARRREAQLRGAAPLSPSATVLPPAASTTQTEAERLASETRAALGRPELPEGFVNPVEAPGPALPSPIEDGTGTFSDPVIPIEEQPSAALDLDRDNPSISNEQDFTAVSSERDIAEDAERLAVARQQYQVVTPTELERPDSTGPNVFAYALGPARAVGTSAYRRGLGASADRAARKCQTYRSDDVAQEEFLSAGGPGRDRLGLDPDGDGNACGWDPAVVRKLVRN